MICQARRPARGDGDCDGPVAFEVVYRSAAGKVLSRTPGCFGHCMAELDRHQKAAGIARADVEPLTPEGGPPHA